jgi:hypothetical protein
MRNRLDSLTRNAQRVYREIGVALSADERQDVQKVLNDCAVAGQLEEAEELQHLLAETERVATLLTTAMLNSSGMDGVAASSSSPPPQQGGTEVSPTPVIDRF